MQRTAGFCKSEQQAAGSILVVGVILNDSGLRSGLSDFDVTDIAFSGALESMAAELKFTSG